MKPTARTANGFEAGAAVGYGTRQTESSLTAERRSAKIAAVVRPRHNGDDGPSAQMSNGMSTRFEGAHRFPYTGVSDTTATPPPSGNNDTGRCWHFQSLRAHIFLYYARNASGLVYEGLWSAVVNDQAHRRLNLLIRRLWNGTLTPDAYCLINKLVKSIMIDRNLLCILVNWHPITRAITYTEIDYPGRSAN